jgi:hypothetical protein
VKCNDPKHAFTCAETIDDAPSMPRSTCSPAPPAALHAAAKNEKVAETQELAANLSALAPSAPQKEAAPLEDESSNDSFSKGAEEWLYAEIEKQSCLPSGTLSLVQVLQPKTDCISSGHKRKRADVQKEEEKEEEEKKEVEKENAEEKDNAEEKEKEKKLMEKEKQNHSLSFSFSSPSSTATFPCLSSSESSVLSSSPPKAACSAAERSMGAEALADKDKDEGQEMQAQNDDVQELDLARHDAQTSGQGCCSSVPAQAKAVVTDEEVHHQSVAREARELSHGKEPNAHGRVECVLQLSGEGTSSINANSVVMSAREGETLLEQEANVSPGAKSPIKNVADDSKDDQGSCGHFDAHDLSAALIGAPPHRQLDETTLR